MNGPYDEFTDRQQDIVFSKMGLVQEIVITFLKAIPINPLALKLGSCGYIHSTRQKKRNLRIWRLPSLGMTSRLDLRTRFQQCQLMLIVYIRNSVDNVFTTSIFCGEKKLHQVDNLTLFYWFEWKRILSLTQGLLRITLLTKKSTSKTPKKLSLTLFFCYERLYVS